MKTKRSFVVVLAFLMITLGITACNMVKPEESNSRVEESEEKILPTEEEVMAAYDKAQNLISLFYVSSLSVDDSKPSVEYNGYPYYVVDDQIDGKQIRNMKDWHDLLNTVFSKELIVGTLQSRHYYIEVDGVLYGHGGMKGIDPAYGGTSFLYEKVSDTKILLTANMEYTTENDGGSRSVLYYLTTIYVYEQIDDRWVFTFFPWRF